MFRSIWVWLVKVQRCVGLHKSLTKQMLNYYNIDFSLEMALKVENKCQKCTLTHKLTTNRNFKLPSFFSFFFLNCHGMERIHCKDCIKNCSQKCTVKSRHAGSFYYKWLNEQQNDANINLLFLFYIYAFIRRFYPKRLTLHSSYSFTFLSALAFPGNRTHDLGVASAMLYYLSYRKFYCELTL